MRTRRWLLNAVTAAMLGGVGACGGGGGSDDALAPTINITTANVGTVAHMTVAGVWGLSLGATAPLAVGSPGSARSMSAWLQAQSTRAASAWGQREHPLDVIGPIVEPCPYGGSMSVTWDDRDNDKTISVGDVVTSVASACQNAPGETTNGAMTITALSQSLGRIAMTQLSFDTARHSMTLNGSVLLEDVSADTVRTTAEGAVTVGVTLKHLIPQFNDNVTLHNGFVAQETFGTAETVSTFNGYLQSREAGGVVQVSTTTSAPIRQRDADDYPYLGTVQVNGIKSTLKMTVLSANDVRLDLDADGNGGFESTSTVSWDWLL